MTYVALAKLKTNSVSTTLTGDITNSAATIPVADLTCFYDADAALILKGIVLGFDDAVETRTEEITITGASGTTGAGNLTGATRGIKADGSIGIGYAWGSGTKIAVMLSTGIYDQICDNIAAHETNKATKVISDYIKLDPMGASVPATNGATVDEDETTTYKNQYDFGLFPQSGDGVKRLQWNEILKEDWKSDGTITLKVHWTVKTGTVGHTGKWELLGKQIANGESLDQALISIGTVEDAIIGNEYEHISASTGAAAISGTAGSLALFELRRIASSGTETTSDMRMLGGSVKYTRTLAA